MDSLSAELPGEPDEKIIKKELIFSKPDSWTRDLYVYLNLLPTLGVWYYSRFGPRSEGIGHLFSLQPATSCHARAGKDRVRKTAQPLLQAVGGRQQRGPGGSAG